MLNLAYRCCCARGYLVWNPCPWEAITGSADNPSYYYKYLWFAFRWSSQIAFSHLGEGFQIPRDSYAVLGPGGVAASGACLYVNTIDANTATLTRRSVSEGISVTVTLLKDPFGLARVSRFSVVDNGSYMTGVPLGDNDYIDGDVDLQVSGPHSDIRFRESRPVPVFELDGPYVAYRAESVSRGGVEMFRSINTTFALSSPEVEPAEFCFSGTGEFGSGFTVDIAYSAVTGSPTQAIGSSLVQPYLTDDVGLWSGNYQALEEGLGFSAFFAAGDGGAALLRAQGTLLTEYTTSSGTSGSNLGGVPVTPAFSGSPGSLVASMTPTLNFSKVGPGSGPGAGPGSYVFLAPDRYWFEPIEIPALVTPPATEWLATYLGCGGSGTFNVVTRGPEGSISVSY